MASLLGKRVISQRLLGSLQVDIHKTGELLDWKPLVSVDEGLRKAME
jgi:nucleoside-diphosphate-sugar epimerase